MVNANSEGRLSRLRHISRAIPGSLNRGPKYREWAKNVQDLGFNE
jgi:hypothetical protein